MYNFCPQRHEFTEANTRWITAATGRRYRQCRACHNDRARLKYRHDDAWREKEKQRTRDNYRFREDARAEEQVQAESQHGAFQTVRLGGNDQGRDVR